MKIDSEITRNRRNNLRNWIENECENSQAKFVEITGINQGELSGLLRDKSFGEKKARSLESQAGMPNLWLDKNHQLDEGEVMAVMQDMPSGTYMANMQKLVQVPVIGKAMGGLPDCMFTDEGRPINGHDEFAEVFSSDNQAFVIKVDGNSMFPKYVQGDYALIEPNTETELEDDVLIKTINGEVMLKRLISRRGGIHLASYNDTQSFIFQQDEIRWMYHVAYPIQSRKIKHRV